MLFFALGTEKEGVGKGQELKNILAENDFRDVDDVSARVHMYRLSSKLNLCRSLS